MHKKPLLVLIVSGWGVASNSKTNLFDNFLEDYLQIFPSFSIKNTENNLQKRYEIFNQNISEILSDHDIRQFRLAGPDRYAMITDTINVLEEYKFISYPPAESLKEIPSGNLRLLQAEFKKLMKHEDNTCIFAVVETIRTMSFYKDPELMKQSIKEVEKATKHIISTALNHNYRILLFSDGGLAEDFLNLDNHTVSNDYNSNPIPIMLIDHELEGVRALPEDIGGNELLPLNPNASLADIAPTILSLFNIPTPDQMQGKPLFVNL